MQEFFQAYWLLLAKIVTLLIIISSGFTVFFWSKGLYIMFKTYNDPPPNIRVVLEGYVESKYLIRASFSALCTSLLVVAFALIWKSIVFLMLGVLWTALFSLMFFKSRTWFKEAVNELG